MPAETSFPRFFSSASKAACLRSRRRKVGSNGVVSVLMTCVGSALLPALERCFETSEYSLSETKLLFAYSMSVIIMPQVLRFWMVSQYAANSAFNSAFEASLQPLRASSLQHRSEERRVGK